MNRREFVKPSVVSSAALLARSSLGEMPAAVEGSALAAPQPFPRGKIAGVSFSRLMFGGNITNSWMHARDLSYVGALARHYNTEEKIDQTFQQAEALGIDTAVGGVDYMVRHVRRYNEKHSGEMKLICWLSPRERNPDRLRENLKAWKDQGVRALFYNGAAADALIAQKGDAAIDDIAYVAEHVREAGLPFGMAAHDLKTLELCEKHPGIAPEFYFKTFHHLSYPTAPKPEDIKRPDAEVPGYWCADPQAVIQFMQASKKPWVAFKVLAAGAIPPRNGFRYAFLNGADFICVGMLDFQLQENCKLALEAIGTAQNRSRPWQG